ncbi:OPT oligopeptide transporter protein-domain-containing protein [Hyaloscypha sp. PMI_1271]|nr:OPT oligopeptide transporter protein-domain-containing protein [Hyaloscypha sp. PMI_1271]
MHGSGLCLNPGPFNIKEHGVIVVMANATFGNGVGDFTDTIVAQRGFYGQHFFWGFNFMLGFSAQCVGFGIVGLMRKYLVEPASMIWPQTLVSASFMYALHDHSKTETTRANGWSISRYRYFLYAFTGSFLIWHSRQALERVRICYIITWIRPKNVVINQLFGGWTGISLIPITLDVGTWFAEYLSISDSNSYGNTGKAYNVSRILTPQFTLDEAKYKAYSPLFLSTAFAMSYGLAFAFIAAIWIRAKAAERSLDNNHMKMMRKYKAVPDWCFATCLAWPTNLSRWALIIALLISFVWTILIGIVYATTNIHLGLNVCTKYIIGYMQPGRPLAMMLFKTYGCITINQAHFFLQDLKLGLYLKVPQRVTFFAQVLGTLECALNHIKGICKSGQADNFTLIFGLIGPQRIFSTGSIYSTRFFSAPIFFGGMGQLPPATPLSYLSWSLLGLVFQKFIRNRYRGWWIRFNYITSAGLDVGLAIATIVIIAALNLTGTGFPD